MKNLFCLGDIQYTLFSYGHDMRTIDLWIQFVLFCALINEKWQQMSQYMPPDHLRFISDVDHLVCLDAWHFMSQWLHTWAILLIYLPWSSLISLEPLILVGLCRVMQCSSYYAPCGRRRFCDGGVMRYVWISYCFVAVRFNFSLEGLSSLVLRWVAWV